MFGVKIEIVRFTDDSQPGWVECLLTDAHGRRWSFIEKVPIVTAAWLDASVSYPQPGVIAGEVVGQEGATVSVDTTRSWAVECGEGETRFTVLRNSLVEL